MALVDDTICRGRGRLSVLGALVAAALMAPVAELSAQSPPPTAIAAFLLDGDRYTTIEAPESGVELFPTGIDDRGQIVGEYIVDASKESAFVRDKRGRFTIIDVPGAQGTEPHRINNRGQIVGFSASDPASTTLHGFLLRRGVKGPFTPIDFPGAPRTLAADINDRGQIVGAYENTAAAPDRQPSPMRTPMMMSGF